MTKLYIVALEPLETRYTGHWFQYLPKQISANTSLEVIQIAGEVLEDAVTEGAFLNFSSTVNWKSDQIKQLAVLFNKNQVKNGDKFLFTDFWNPGAHFIRYMADLLGLTVEIIGICHAGAYDPHDLLGQKMANKRWANNLEQSFDSLYDKLIFATNFSRDLYLRGVKVDYMPEKHIVTGFPMEYYDEVLPCYWDLGWRSQKENLIIFPHRKSPEKNIELFYALKDKLPQYEFVVCSDVAKTKADYHNLLYRSKLMFSGSFQETLGIGTYESLRAGAAILVPDRLSYTEMYWKMFKYDPDIFIFGQLEVEMLTDRINNTMINFDSYKEKIKAQCNAVGARYFNGIEFYYVLEN